MRIHLAKVYDSPITICVKAFIADRVTVPAIIFKRPMFWWLQAGRSGDRIPVGARFSAPVQTGTDIHPASCTMGTGSFPGVKSGRGVMLIPNTLLVPLVMKEYRYTSTPPIGRTACTEPQCLYKVHFTFTFKERQKMVCKNIHFDRILIFHGLFNLLSPEFYI